MQAPISWLKEYVEFDQTPDELAHQLTMAGVPVATIHYPAQSVNNVITGRIIEMKKHPNADKLSICTVDVGRAETLTIVTGAANVRVGHVVPVATEGAELPNGVTIAPTELRGVRSFGMLCSGDELCLNKELVSIEIPDGILLLPQETAIGVDVRTAMGWDDAILEFELTANRADCFSIKGIAREIAALNSTNLKATILNVRENEAVSSKSQVSIEIEEKKLCSRFAIRVLQNIKVGDSPQWLRDRLHKAGMRSINNVVDVTNYVMLELGQPLHAYDQNMIAKHRLVVRKAHQGEKLTTLDEVKRELTNDMLVIADEVQAVGIAGVMGGLASEVTASTSTILLEAAAFDGTSVRRTARALGLRSEASSRFEKGVDVANLTRALDRAAQLLEKVAAAQVMEGIVEEYPEFTLQRQLELIPQKANRYLGTAMSEQEMADILKRLGFEIVSAATDKISVIVPAWRGDVTLAVDLYEELARIYGFDRIEAKAPRGEMVRGSESVRQSVISRLKQCLTAAGMDETISFSFSHPSVFDKLNLAENDRQRQAVPLLNPITEDFPIMRTTLLANLLETAVKNLSRRNDDLKLYEVGAVYLPKNLPMSELPSEPWRLSGLLIGRRNPVAWCLNDENVDFYDAKGIVEKLLQSVGLNFTVESTACPTYHPGRSAVFIVGGEEVAWVGELHPLVSERFDIDKRVYLFDIDLDRVITLLTEKIVYQALPKFPSIQRDLAIVVKRDIEVQGILTLIKKEGGPLLTEVRLFDVYTGEQIDNRLKSLAISIIFRDPSKTLSESDIEGHYENILVRLEEKYGAELRK
ncbi:phenylalanine--tRNA ligase subunit beta [Azotosporobacter soli]|uniref:phenylalanine--tRNA ligase subunit beta n=1 Tax=Azotosporobacter soli TaxID=3055040 RepID=UPI0031FF0FC9